MNYVGSIIEQMRVDKGITIENLVTDICSRRQYHRYKTGQHEISNLKLMELLDRLDVDFLFFSRKLAEFSNETRSELRKQFSKVNSMKFNEVDKFLREVPISHSTSIIDNQLYSLLRIIVDYQLGRVTKTHCRCSIMRLIDFPNCLDKKLLNQVEINGLIYVIQLSDDIEIDGIVEKLSQVNKEKNIQWYDYLVLSVNLAQYYGKKGDFDVVMQIAKEMQDIYSKDATLKALTNLSYFRLLAAQKLDDVSLNDAKETFCSLLVIEKNDARSNFFKNDFFETFKETL